MPGVVWQFFVDWDNDGDFSDADEAISDYVMSAEWRLGMAKPFDLMASEAECSLTLNNEDKRFSPESTASPYGTALVPWRRMRVQSVYNGGTTVHWTGYVESIQPEPGEGRSLTAALKGCGTKSLLQDNEVFLELQVNQTVDVVIELIIDQFDELLPTSMETGLSEMTYVADNWRDGVDGYTAIRSLLDAEQGRFFLDRGGTMVFWNRHHLLRNTSAVGTVTAWHEMRYEYGADVVNDVRTACQPRKISSGTADVLWQQDEAVSLKAGDSRTLRCRYADSSGAEIGGMNVIQPNVGDGSLAYTGALTVGGFVAAARSAEITFTATTDAEISTLIIRGTKITSFNKQELAAEDADSITAYGRKTLIVATGLLSEANEAASVGRYILGRRKKPIGVVSALTILNKTDTEQAAMIAWTMGDRIHVQDAQTGHEKDHYIIGEQHRVERGKHTCTWVLEPGDTNQYWVLGVSRLGVDTKLAY